MHPAQVVAVAVLAGGDVVLAVHGDGAGAAVAAAGVLAGEPDRRAAVTTCGITVSWSHASVKDRVSSHRPNGSVSRTVSGPTS